jgi:hypothetical protein
MSRIRRRFLVWGPALALALAAGAAVGGVFPENPAPAPDKVTVRYKARPGDRLKYRNVVESVRAMERAEQAMEFVSKSDYTYTLTAEASGDDLSFVLTIEEAASSTEGFRGAQERDMSGYQGKRLRVKLDPSGEQKEIAAIDSLPVPERRGGQRERRAGGPPGGRRFNPAAQFGVGFMILPDRSLSVGDTWTETSRDTVRPDATGRFFSQEQLEEKTVTWKILGKEKKMGLSCLHIELKATYVRESQGTMRDMTITSEEEGESEFEVWFAPAEGILVEMVFTDFSEGSRAMSGDRGGTMPMSSETQRTLKLLEYDPAK